MADMIQITKCKFCNNAYYGAVQEEDLQPLNTFFSLPHIEKLLPAKGDEVCIPCIKAEVEYFNNTGESWLLQENKDVENDDDGSGVEHPPELSE